MPKFIDYPRASFSRSLELAAAVNILNGQCTYEECAKQMGIKVTGGFTAIIGAASKHGLVLAKRNKLKTTLLYNNINAAISVLNRRNYLRKAFLNPPLYNKVYTAYQNKELPLNNLAQIFTDDFEVDEKLAVRVSGYFIEGLKITELLENDKLITINDLIIYEEPEAEKIAPKEKEKTAPVQKQPLLFIEENKKEEQVAKVEKPIKEKINIEPYQVHITGTGLDIKLTLAENDDVFIIDAILKKVKNKFPNNQ